MVGMPLLNLGYALGGLSQGYNQSQQQAMQRAAQQLAIQQALSQQNAQRLAARGLQAGLLGQGGGLGGFGRGFSPGNIQPVSQPAPIPGVTTPSPQPPPPNQQQPPPAGGSGGGGITPQQALDFPWEGGGWYGARTDPPTQEQVPDSSLKKPETIPLDDPEQGPQGAVGPSGPSGATSAPPVTTTPDTKPAPGPSSGQPEKMLPGNKKLDEPSTTSDAPGGTGGGGGDEFAIKIPGGPSIPMSQFFGSVDYGHLAQGIAKLAPPGTDQADIYQAVVDLSKLAEGNKTQQQQAGLILRELIKQPFELEKIDRRAAGAANVANIRGQTSRDVGAAHDATRVQIAQLQQQKATLDRDARQANFLANQNRLTKNHQDQLDHQFAVLQNTAAQLGYREISLRMSAIRGEISTIKGTAGTFSEAEQKRLAALNDEFVRLAGQIKPSPAAPTADQPAD